MARTASRATSVAGAVPVLSGLLSQRRGEGVKSNFSRDAPGVRDDSDGTPRWTERVPAYRHRRSLDTPALGVQEVFVDPTRSPDGETADLCACRARRRKLCWDPGRSRPPAPTRASMSGVSRRPSDAGMILAGVVVVAAGLGVALVKTLELPSYTIPFVIGGAFLAVGLIRRLSRP